MGERQVVPQIENGPRRGFHDGREDATGRGGRGRSRAGLDCSRRRRRLRRGGSWHSPGRRGVPSNGRASALNRLRRDEVAHHLAIGVDQPQFGTAQAGAVTRALVAAPYPRQPEAVIPPIGRRKRHVWTGANDPLPSDVHTVDMEGRCRRPDAVAPLRASNERADDGAVPAPVLQPGAKWPSEHGMWAQFDDRVVAGQEKLVERGPQQDGLPKVTRPVRGIQDRSGGWVDRRQEPDARGGRTQPAEGSGKLGPALLYHRTVEGMVPGKRHAGRAGRSEGLQRTVDTRGVAGNDTARRPVDGGDDD